MRLALWTAQQDTGSTTMATSTAFALGRRNRVAPIAQDAASLAPATIVHPLVGTELGTVERRFGLMATSELVRIADVVSTSDSLAVADRFAFIASMQSHMPVVVLEFEGWYIACLVDRPLDVADLLGMHSVDGAPRLMSVVTDRGITPALGPLAS